MELMEIEGTLQIPETHIAHGVWIRTNARTTWHAVENFKVYVYAAMGGGYDSIVNARTFCETLIRIDEGQLRNDRPTGSMDGKRCEKCEQLIEECL